MVVPRGTRGVKTNSQDGRSRLSQSDLQFIQYLLETGVPVKAGEKLIEWEIEQGLRDPKDEKSREVIYTISRSKLSKPDIQKEYWRQMEKITDRNVADAVEVMQYFTQVMRGEIKDQFGLDASLSDRTQAAKELAKRTVDMENRMNGKPDAVVSISLNWKRDS